MELCAESYEASHWITEPGAILGPNGTPSFETLLGIPTDLKDTGNSLISQWSGLSAFTAKGPGFNPWLENSDPTSLVVWLYFLRFYWIKRRACFSERKGRMFLANLTRFWKRGKLLVKHLDGEFPFCPSIGFHDLFAIYLLFLSKTCLCCEAGRHNPHQVTQEA